MCNAAFHSLSHDFITKASLLGGPSGERRQLELQFTRAKRAGGWPYISALFRAFLVGIRGGGGALFSSSGGIGFKMVPRWCKVGPRWLLNGSWMAQDGPRWRKLASRRCKVASTWLPNDSKMAQAGSKMVQMVQSSLDGANGTK